MYQSCCRKCGSTSLHTEVKGNNTGLYCDEIKIKEPHGSFILEIFQKGF